MAETFKVGEIALFNRPGSQYDGAEVTITLDLHFSLINDRKTGEKTYAYVYGIDGPFRPRLGFIKFCALPEHLKKRYLPPNWEDIAMKDDLPLEEEIEMEALA